MNRHTTLPSLLLLVAIMLATSLPARAAIFNVDSTSDDATATACDDAITNDCSLRGATLAANALLEASTINVPAGTYVLSQSSSCTFTVKPSGTFASSQIPLCLTKPITIQGAGANATIIDADQRARVLFVSADAVAEVRGVALENGTGTSSIFSGTGGGILSYGTLTLTETVVSNNTLPTGFTVNQGAGIANFGTLTVRRSAVVNNVALLHVGGGGIYNDGLLGGVLTVSDSTISSNGIGTNGGGILNRGTATIINCTISDNITHATLGGGIANLGTGNFTATLTVINSTISGNTSGSLGGGIYNGGGTTVHLNNVTLTNNAANAHFNAASGSRGGGGINNGADGVFSLRNTLIAGNRDLGSAGPVPDCAAGAQGNGSPVTSLGYNLIQDPTGCIVVGDTTGNITGQDPRLGPLANYGGLTHTHTLLAGSPAIDAGNPAAPGSGGTSCAALDQRGLARPDGVACDIGAFEDRGGFAVSSVSPSRGGNTGTVTLSVFGSGLAAGTTVTLLRAGQSAVLGNPVTVAAGGDVAFATFDLTNAVTGSWDVVVTNAAQTAATQPGAFTVEPGGASELWVDIVGNQFTRATRTSRYFIHFGNRGNVDAHAVPLTLSVPAPFPWVLRFPVTPPPAQAGQVLEDWGRTHIEVLPAAQTGGLSNIPLVLSIVPAGFAGVLEFTLTPPSLTPGATSFPLVVAIDPPLFDSTLDPATMSSLVDGARTYVQQGFAETIPAALVPDLEPYARNQFHTLVAHGRRALVSNVGTAVPVYSLAQLQIDLALFGLARTLRSRSIARRGPDWLSAISDRVAALPLFTWGPPSAYAQQQNCPPVPKGGILPEGCSGGGGDSVGPPPLAFPPECDLDNIKQQLSDPIGTIKFFASPPDCKITPDQCTALPGHHILHTSDGNFCAPDRPPGKDCPNINIPNPVLPSAGAVSCGIFPLRSVASRDPNDKVGTLGVTPSQFLVNGVPLHYTVNFENVETATAAAQEVVITDQLDVAQLDLDTFSLGPIAFGDTTLTPAPGVSQYTGGVDLRPAQDLLVLIKAGLDKGTGIVTWRFTAVDPQTLQFPEDPLAGFLPPNVNPPEGDGSVAFTIAPKSGLSTGATICNQASIVFDVNDAILTPEWCNTIDATPPQSSVLPLAPVQTAATFFVQWQGTDSGAGIGDFTIFVSEDGGTFVPWLSDTTYTAAMYTGQVGRTYAFCSRSRDLVGMVETKACPPTADTSTTIVLAAAATATPTEVPPTASAATPPASATPTATSTRTQTAIDTPTATATCTPTRTSTPSHPPTASRTVTPTTTPTKTATQAPVDTPTRTSTMTRTRTPRPANTSTPSRTGTPTATATRTRTHTPTTTRAATATRTPTRAPTARATVGPTPGPTGCADVDGDGQVTWRDVAAETLALLFARHDLRFDVNRDRRVSFEDLVIVVSQLGRPCAPSSRAFIAVRRWSTVRSNGGEGFCTYTRSSCVRTPEDGALLSHWERAPS